MIRLYHCRRWCTLYLSVTTAPPSERHLLSRRRALRLVAASSMIRLARFVTPPLPNTQGVSGTPSLIYALPKNSPPDCFYLRFFAQLEPRHGRLRFPPSPLCFLMAKMVYALSVGNYCPAFGATPSVTSRAYALPKNSPPDCFYLRFFAQLEPRHGRLRFPPSPLCLYK